MDWSSLITPLVILATAVIAWNLQRGIASKTATLNFIASQETDNPEWLRLRERFAELRDTEKLLAIAADRQKPENRKAIVEVTSFLNHFELVAVGIKHGIIHEGLYMEWFRGPYVHVWKDSEPFIVAMRQQKQRKLLFCEFEELAQKWSEQAD